MSETTYEKNEPSQVAFITNNKTLLSACDYLELATSDDKCPAGLHAGYSRIRLAVTDFSKEPSVYLTFHLKPEEIRRLHTDVQFHRQMKLLGKAAPYQADWHKKKPKEGKICAEALSISYESEMSVPWKIKISSGFYASDAMNAKASYNKFTQKFLTDIEFEDFLCKIVTYLTNWESVVGAPYMRDLHKQLAERFSGENKKPVVAVPGGRNGQSKKFA